MNRRRFVTAAILTGASLAGCASPEDDGGDEETGGGAYGKVDARSRPTAP
mgnify:CR=1 FL=1